MRRPGLRAATVAAALLALPLAGALPTPAAGAPRCLADEAPRNSWSAVPADPGAVVAQLGDDPCRLLEVTAGRQVRTTYDGGRSWRPTAIVPVEIGRAVTSGLPAGQALLLPARPGGSTPGVFLVTDFGRRVTAAAGLPGRAVTDLAVAGSTVYAAAGDPTSALLAVATSATPCTASVCVSHDGGRTFSGVAGPGTLRPTQVAVVPGQPQHLWLDDRGTGLYESTDGGRTATPVGGSSASQAATWTVRDLLATPARGGGVQLVVATSAGLQTTVDGGATFTHTGYVLDVRRVAVEAGHPSALELMTTHLLVRSPDRGVTLRQSTRGLPAGCRPVDLQADRETPTTFLTRCDEGGWWRYRSDGTDLEGTQQASPADAPGTRPVAEAAVAMATHAEVKLPQSDTEHGSVAFDGHRLVYTTQTDQVETGAGILRTFDLRTRQRGPDIVTDIPVPFGDTTKVLVGVTYDSLRDLLYVTADTGAVYSVDPRTGRARRMFVSPVFRDQPVAVADHAFEGTGSLSYDPELDRFRGVADAGTRVVEVDRGGRVTAQCSLPTNFLAAADLDRVKAITGNSTDRSPFRAAAVVATGDGDAYVEMEDDISVLHVDRSCHLLEVLQHSMYSEAPKENDALACDTVTFAPQPVVWIRDSDKGTAAAYDVPSGYCALATRLEVPRAAARSACVSLRLAGSGEPLPAQPVTLLRADRVVGRLRTAADGGGCATLTPGTGNLLAVFLGTVAYRPATGHAPLRVAAPVAPARAAEPQPAAAEPAPPPIAFLGAAPAAPAPAPPAQPPQAIQPQSVVQPQWGFAAEDQEQPQAAAEDGSTDALEFSARRDPAPASRLLWLAAAGMAGSLAVRRARRAHVRQPRAAGG